MAHGVRAVSSRVAATKYEKALDGFAKTSQGLLSLADRLARDPQFFDEPLLLGHSAVGFGD